MRRHSRASRERARSPRPKSAKSKSRNAPKVASGPSSRIGLPLISLFAEFPKSGGLIAYGPRLVQLYRDIFARQCVKLLRGAKPTDLPVEQPTQFYLVVNLKTAKALGLTISESLLARADTLIE